MYTPKLDEVILRKGFLKSKYDLNLKITMDAVYQRFFETGRIDAFKCDWKENEKNKPHFYWDSDVAKWMEAAAYILSCNDDPELKERVETLISRIEENQGDDGYFNIYYTVVEPENRFTDRDRHELYCAGHLIEAAVAYYENCGDERFLNIMRKYADYIYQVFVVEKSAAFSSPGHEEIELALFKLYRATKEKRYMDLAMHFLNVRGTDGDTGKSCQSHMPVRKQFTAEGHSVRALYLYSAMADAVEETNDEEMKKACDALFFDITNRKMYITGGLGQTWYGEAFTTAYDLPNDSAYAETCAAIAMIFFCSRMWKTDPLGKYQDIIEKELYNGMISGLSLNGKAFFYENPLEIDLISREKQYDELEKKWGLRLHFPITERKEIFGCSCCPPNINRLLADIGEYIYSVDGKTVYINQFVDSELDCGIRVSQKTDYPRDGKISITSSGAETIMLRIPSWCKDYKISCDYTLENGYAKITEDKFSVEFSMDVKFIEANPRVVADAAKIAVMRGPVVYCAEGMDNEFEVHNLYIDTNASANVSYEATYGLPVISINGFAKKETDALYSELGLGFDPTQIKLIPYYCFANRGETTMRVWLRQYPCSTL